MNCAVCQNPRDAAVCSVCGFDNEAPQANDPAALREARNAFRARGLKPRVKIGGFDKLRPWLAVLLGFFIFATWLKACHNPGWPFWN